LHHRQRLEIKEQIKLSSGVDISEGELSILESRFLEHVTHLHLLKAEVLKEAMLEKGGYAMHIDSTCESGRGMTVVFYAGWHGWVLGAWKIASEREDVISPHLKEVEGMFGKPVSYMTDLGKGMMQTTAVAAASHDTPPRVFICHMHFIKAIGINIFEKSRRPVGIAARVGNQEKTRGHR
jgi:hypothetical protein